MTLYTNSCVVPASTALYQLSVDKQVIDVYLNLNLPVCWAIEGGLLTLLLILAALALTFQCLACDLPVSDWEIQDGLAAPGIVGE
jgi:hypothetical protein